MIVRLAVLTLLGTAAGVASAQDSTSGRYSIAPSDYGFVRMDTTTGRTSHCAKRDDAWYCEPISEVGEAVEDRVEALGDAISALDAKVDALAADLAEQQRQARARAAEERAAPAPAPPQPTGFVVRVMERFVGMVRGLKLGGES